MSSTISNNPYGKRANGGMHGDVFTNKEVVEFMLDLVGYTEERDLREISVLEPSCGEGEFILEILKRLRNSAKKFGFAFKTAALRNVSGFDLDFKKIEICKIRINTTFPEFCISDIVNAKDFLSTDLSPCDIIVGNPPYVRYERLTDSMKKDYKQKFKTFHYRSDLYIPFYEKSLMNLKSGGVHCFICSNRWLKCEYGRKLRKLIAGSFHVSHIINLEKATPFQEDVSAYTNIVVINNSLNTSGVHVAECDDTKELERLKYIIKEQPYGDDWSNIFREAPADKLISIEGMGAKIGIGVATGATKIFIGHHLKGKIEDSLLIPAIDSSNLRGNKLIWDNKFLLNPYAVDKKLINLELYPKCKQYLEGYKGILNGRHIAKNNPANWYQTIDMIDRKLTSKPKILLPDMSGNNKIFIDEGQFYPLHNIYYITGLKIDKLKVLAAILMSSSTRKQLSEITTTMNGGFPRWQSQHLRKLLLPNILTMSKSTCDKLMQLYDKTDIIGIDETIKSYLS